MHWAYRLRDPLHFRRLFLHFYLCVSFPRGTLDTIENELRKHMISSKFWA